MEDKPTNLNSDRMMALAAVFISLMSLLAIVYQSYLGREEYKLKQIQQSASVLPYLSTWFSDRDNAFHYVLENRGVGPAFIKDVKIKVLDKKKDTLVYENTDQVLKHLIENLPTLDSLDIVTSTLRKDLLLPANAKIEIFKIGYTANGQDDLIRKALREVIIFQKIEYEDVYGNRWKLSMKDSAPVKI